MEDWKQISNKRSDWIITNSDLEDYRIRLESLRSSMMILSLRAISGYVEEWRPVFRIPEGLKFLSYYEIYINNKLSRFLDEWSELDQQKRVLYVNYIISEVIDKRISTINYQLGRGKAVLITEYYELKAYSLKEK